MKSNKDGRSLTSRVTKKRKLGKAARNSVQLGKKKTNFNVPVNEKKIEKNRKKTAGGGGGEKWNAPRAVVDLFLNQREARTHTHTH